MGHGGAHAQRGADAGGAIVIAIMGSAPKHLQLAMNVLPGMDTPRNSAPAVASVEAAVVSTGTPRMQAWERVRQRMSARVRVCA